MIAYKNTTKICFAFSVKYTYILEMLKFNEPSIQKTDGEQLEVSRKICSISIYFTFSTVSLLSLLLQLREMCLHLSLALSPKPVEFFFCKALDPIFITKNALKLMMMIQSAGTEKFVYSLSRSERFLQPHNTMLPCSKSDKLKSHVLAPQEFSHCKEIHLAKLDCLVGHLQLQTRAELCQCTSFKCII